MPDKTFQSLDRLRAELAWSQVSKLPPKALPEYRSLARNFPSMIQSMGIGQAVAFLMAKKDKKEHQTYLKHLTAWLCDSFDSPIPWRTPSSERPQDRPFRLFELLQREESRVWRYADREAIEYASWLKRFAEALAPAKNVAGHGSKDDAGGSGEEQALAAHSGDEGAASGGKGQELEPQP